MNEKQKAYIEELPFPTNFTCVDMIIEGGGDYPHIAMIKKSKDDFLRLPGGFVDPTDLSYVDAAKRETHEEIGIHVKDWINTGFSCLTMDRGRYNPDESRHRLRTHLMTASTRGEKTLPRLTAGDDAVEAEWVALNKFHDMDWVCKNVISGHIPIIFWWLGHKYWR